MKSRSLKVALIIGLVVAAGSASYLWFERSQSTDGRLTESTRRSHDVLERYFNTDDNGSKRAILDHIQYLDKLSSESGDASRNPYARDAITWFVRLAKLDERNKGATSPEYIHEARARCERFGIADCSEEALRNQVDQLDETALSSLRK